MRKELRFGVPPDEAIDDALRDMVARDAPPMLKARVLARLGDEAIDAALRDIAARETPSTLRARVMARLDEESTRADRAQEKRWTLARPLLRPALGLAAAGLVAATGLTVWLSRTPPAPAAHADRVANRPIGAPEGTATGKGPRAQSEGAATSSASSPGVSPGNVVATRASRSTASPRTIRAARRTTTWPGAGSEDAATDANDPLAIKHLRVEPLAVSTIAIPPIEVTPVEIVPPMSDTAPSPPGESGAESRTGG